MIPWSISWNHGLLTYLALGLLLLAVATVGLSSRKTTPKPKSPARTQAPTEPVATAHLRHVVPPVERPVPLALLNLKLIPYSELPAPQAQALLSQLQSIPRPPRALDKLVSADFLATANSSALSELMAGEPQIAAKVLANVTAPIYGLKKPPESIGQAVTYLGMNTVRGICMQYMLDTAFRPASPELNVCYETIWEASNCASELCFKLAQLLNLPDPGNLVTQVLLSYIGPLTTYSLLDKETVLRLAQSDPIEQARLEQELLGLCASEIGTLLMQSWNVPAGLIQDVRDTARVMVAPCAATTDMRSPRLALCYLCNRMGYMIARGELVDIRSFDVMHSEALEHFYFPSYLRHPSLQRLMEFLQFPEVVASVDRMAGAARLRHQRTAR